MNANRVYLNQCCCTDRWTINAVERL